MEKKDTIGLNKFISDNGVCSRRQADKYIEKGAVYVNGKVAKIADRIKIGDRVMVNGNLLDNYEGDERVYIALNKPVGVTSTTESGVKGNIVDYVNHTSRVFPIGRLDKDSQGLILLTNDGNIVNKILRAEHNHEKEYLVHVYHTIKPEFIEAMASGVPILGKVTKKCKVTQVSPTSFRIVLVQGLNRQIRRMCEYLGQEVVRLERTRIMHITLRGIANGEWRILDNDEVDQLLDICEKESDKKLSKRAKPVRKIKDKDNRPDFKSFEKNTRDADVDEIINETNRKAGSVKATISKVSPKKSSSKKESPSKAEPKKEFAKKKPVQPVENKEKPKGRPAVSAAMIRGLKPSDRAAYIAKMESMAPAEPKEKVNFTYENPKKRVTPDANANPRSKKTAEKDGKAIPSKYSKYAGKKGEKPGEGTKEKSQARVGKSKPKPPKKTNFNRFNRKPKT